MAILTINRVPFNSPTLGLTHNEAAVGGGIESVYQNLLTHQSSYPAFTNLVLDLFTQGTAASYAAAVNELSGAQYADYLQVVGVLAVHV